MAKRRLRLVNGARAGSSGPAEGQPPDEQRTDGFSLRFAGGRGVLRLENERVSETVTVDLFEMAIPRISFPFDVSGGVGGLRDRRLKLSRIVLTITLDHLEQAIRKRLSTSTWVQNPTLAFDESCITVLLDYGPPGSRVPFSFRLLPSAGTRAPSLLLDEPRAYGPLPVPLLLVPAAMVREIAGIRLDGIEVFPPDPVKAALMEILPRKGWRIPNHAEAQLAQVELRADRAVLDYRAPELVDEDPTAGEASVGLMRLRKHEESRLTRTGDRSLCEGDIDAARSAYTRLLDQEPDNPLVAARLSMIDVINRELRDTAQALAATASARAPERTDLHAVLAHGAALAGDTAQEVTALEALFNSGFSLERLAAGLRLGQLLKDDDPEQAAVWLERALRARRENPGAILSLMKVHAVAGNTEEARRLIPRWIAVHKSPGARAQAHLAAGELLLETIGDNAAAVRHFERAALADPENLDAAWGLADALAGTGQAERAISQYERLERRCSEAGDSERAALAVESIGNVWMAAGEPGLAAPRFREALASGPPEPVRHVRLAEALAALGRHAEAASELETALKSTRPDEQSFCWGDKALDLAQIYLDDLSDRESADPWIRAALVRPEVEARAKKLLVQLLESRGSWGELTARLERAVIEDPSADNALALARARLKAGDYEAALSTLVTARKRYPKRDDLLDTLIEASRNAGERSRLRSSLIDRLRTVTDADTRAAMATEIGDLELTAFENPGAAVGWFRRALEEVPDTLEAHEGLAETLRRLGRGEELDQQLERLANALRTAGRSADAARAMAERSQLLVAAGNTNRAAALLREALPELPESDRPTALVEMASLFLASNNPSAARDLFAAARKTPGVEGLHAAALGEAQAALQIGDHEGALEAATAAGSGPAELRSRAAMTAAKALLFLGRAEQAARTLERVAENTEPDESIELLMLAARIQQSELAESARAQELLDRVLEIDAGHEQARQNLIELLESSGDRAALADGLMRLADGGVEGIADLKRAADFFSAEGLHERAVEALRRALEIEPDAETSLMLAHSLKRAGDEAEMLNLLRATSAEDPAARDLLAEELDEAELYEELATLLAAIETDTEEEEVARLLRLARIHREGRNDNQAALACLQQASAIAPSADLHIRIADLLAGPLEQHKEAAISLLAAITLSSSSEERQLAERALTIAESIDDSQLLISCLEEAARTADPKEASSWLIRLSAERERAGDDPGAREALERALKGAPDNATVVTSLATMAAADNNWQRVVELTSSLSDAARPQEIEQLQAEGLEQLGRLDDAIAALRRLVDLDPDAADKLDQLIRLLDQADQHDELTEVLKRRIDLTTDPGERAALLARRAEATAAGAGDSASVLNDLVQAARLQPESLPLASSAAEAAASASEWMIAEEMLSLSIEHTAGEQLGRLLRRRSAIRRSRLDDQRGAADDMLAARELTPLAEPEAEVLIDLLEALHDEKTASAVARDLAEEHPDEAGLHLARAAQLAQLTGNKDAARDLWRRTVAANPEPARTVALVRLLDPAQDTDEMQQLLDSLAGQENLLDIPDHLSMLEARVEMELARGRDLEAVDGLAAMMDLAPSSRDPWQRMIHILERRGEWESLADRMQQRLKMAEAPENIAKTAFALGRVLEEKLGNEAGAVKAFERAIEAVPNHQGAHIALAGLAYSRQQWNELDRHLGLIEEEHATTEILLWRARAAEELGRRADALEICRGIVAEAPTNLAAVDALFRLVGEPEHDREVIAAGERLIAALGPDEVKASVHRRIGLARLRLDDLDGARDSLERANRISEGDPDSLLLLADLHRRQGRYKLQAEVLSKLGFLASGVERAKHLAAAGRICLDRLDDHKRARHWFDRAAEFAPDDPAVLLGLADSAWASGDRPTVVHSLERLRLVKPEFPLGASRLYRLAVSASETGEWPAVDVIETLEHAIVELSGEERDDAQRLANKLRGRTGGP
jgi:tetratricopeptide (TPR) repeat protein